MLDRWRFAIVLALFGFLASAALIAHGSLGGYSELETRWGWAINVACPAHLLITQLFPNVNDGTSLMFVLLIAQTLGNAAIYFVVGALLTRMLGGGR